MAHKYKTTLLSWYMNRRKFLTVSTLTAIGLFSGTLYWPRRWKYIVIHHSAGSYGDIDFLQRVHRERQVNDPIDAIPYHYIIGNGNGLAMGQVASDWRWSYQLWGAHVSTTNLDKNIRGIGICLIGNYDKQAMPKKQYQSLLKLTKSLMAEYTISKENIFGHGFINGETTRCPGKYFSMESFLADIA